MSIAFFYCYRNPTPCPRLSFQLLPVSYQKESIMW